jgi:hypothetical protein
VAGLPDPHRCDHLRRVGIKRRHREVPRTTRPGPARDDVIRAIVDSVEDERKLLHAGLPGGAGIGAGRSQATLENAADAALMGEYWEPLLDLVRRMTQDRQEQFAAIVRSYGAVDPDLLGRIVRRAEEHGFGERFEVQDIKRRREPLLQGTPDTPRPDPERASLEDADGRRSVRLERRRKRRAHYRPGRAQGTDGKCAFSGCDD